MVTNPPLFICTLFNSSIFVYVILVEDYNFSSKEFILYISSIFFNLVILGISQIPSRKPLRNESANFEDFSVNKEKILDELDLEANRRLSAKKIERN